MFLLQYGLLFIEIWVGLIIIGFIGMVIASIFVLIGTGINAVINWIKSIINIISHWHHKSKQIKPIKKVVEEADLKIQLQTLFEENSLLNAFVEAQSFFTTCTQGYFTGSKMDLFIQKYNKVAEIRNIFKKSQKSYYSKEKDSEIDLWLEEYARIEQIRTAHNEAFVVNELEKKQIFFDSILDYPLDKQQRESIVKMEDATLVISAAGGGKSTTMVGKVRYLVDQLGVDPKNILIITYTKKAAQELTDKLHDTNYQCNTFHSVAYHIVNKVEGLRPDVCEENFTLTLLHDLVRNNPDYRKAVIKYYTKLQSLTHYIFDYKSKRAFYTDRIKYGILAPYLDMDKHPIFTKSEEEKHIVSFLHEKGIQFRYEEPYEYDTRTEDRQQYRPDFSIHYTDQNGEKKRLYLEHFGIDKNGNVPSWFGDNNQGWEIANNKYKDGIRWKKETHKKRGTQFIFTTSAMFYDRTWYNQLYNQLYKAGVPMEQLTDEQLLKDLKEQNESVINVQLLRLVESFINLLKCNTLEYNEILKKAKNKDDYRSIDILEKLLKPYYDEYCKQLVAGQKVDYNDLIIKSIEYCKNGKYHSPYKYILVDEFQDISKDRCEFLNALRQSDPLTQLFCVGDDWQSIYRFGGSDLGYFNSFKEIFGHTEECYIETTYRFSNPLLEKTSNFILQNPAQKKKTVRSFNPNTRTDLDFIPVKQNDSAPQTLFDIVSKIPEEKTILILGRYTFNAKNIADGEKILINKAKKEGDPIYLTFKLEDGSSRKIEYMTVHKSKGLQADVVILVECNSGRTGFPSMVADDPVLLYLLSESDHYPFGEERRVFYVAITRAKEQMKVLYSPRKLSPFVSEVGEIGLESRCQNCGIGQYEIVKEGIATSGSRYICYRCFVCGKFETVFCD